MKKKVQKLERFVGFYTEMFSTMSMLISTVNNARDKHADGLRSFKVAKYEPNPQRGVIIAFQMSLVNDTLVWIVFQAARAKQDVLK